MAVRDPNVGPIEGNSVRLPNMLLISIYCLNTTIVLLRGTLIH